MCAFLFNVRESAETVWDCVEINYQTKMEICIPYCMPRIEFWGDNVLVMYQMLNISFNTTDYKCTPSDLSGSFISLVKKKIRLSMLFRQGKDPGMCTLYIISTKLVLDAKM